MGQDDTLNQTALQATVHRPGTLHRLCKTLPIPVLSTPVRTCSLARKCS